MHSHITLHWHRISWRWNRVSPSFTPFHITIILSLWEFEHAEISLLPQALLLQIKWKSIVRSPFHSFSPSLSRTLSTFLCMRGRKTCPENVSNSFSAFDGSISINGWWKRLSTRPEIRSVSRYRWGEKSFMDRELIFIRDSHTLTFPHCFCLNRANGTIFAPWTLSVCR